MFSSNIKKGILRQYSAVICANSISFIYGISVAWPSSSLPLLQSNNSPLRTGPITLLEASWISSVICIGGATGTLFFGWLADKIGRKNTLFVVCIPSAASWLLIEFGDRFLTLFMARFAIGLVGGANFVVIPLIVSEISDTKIRGTIGSLLILILSIGSVVGYVTCSYTDYYTVPWIGIGMTLVFMIGYSFVPETPKYLMTMGKKDEALESLKYFKGDQNLTYIDLELYGIEVGGNNNSSNGMTWQDLKDPAAKKGLIIGVMLMNVCIFSGAFTLSNYYETIFAEAGSTLSPADSSIVVSIVSFAGTYFATLTVEKWGRKSLTLGSSYGCAVCLAIMGFYSFLKDIDVDVSSFNWLPLVTLSLLLFIACTGASTVPFVILSEIYTQNLRRPLITFCMTMNWLESFVMVLLFPYMLLYFKMHGTLWIFSGISIFLASILVVVMPETKGLSIERIVELLAGKNFSKKIGDSQYKTVVM